ncbi:hypothetical protein ASPCAL14947 [Aspergillus calidoustus]|uniref:Uncharacterized protein n=1 Tax=Aspergillus calidoustus TaxID=454130 RepID=A0A0U5CKJ2_ASPCI|nr:hypothetical protein ASPCAL14947 [Aspergillus calidoustus]
MIIDPQIGFISVNSEPSPIFLSNLIVFHGAIERMAPLFRENGPQYHSGPQRWMIEEHLYNLSTQSEILYLRVKRLRSAVHDEQQVWPQNLETLEELIEEIHKTMHLQTEILLRVQELLYGTS